MHVLVMAHGLISIDSVPTSPTCVTVRQIYVCAVCSFKRESLKVFQAEISLLIRWFKVVLFFLGKGKFEIHLFINWVSFAA